MNGLPCAYPSLIREEVSLYDLFCLCFTEPNTGCWIWAGDLNPGGYGKLPRFHLLYRYAYEIAKGPIPKGLVIDHVCKIKSCINPTHLEAVTDYENVRRGFAWVRSEEARAAAGYFAPVPLWDRDDLIEFIPYQLPVTLEAAMEYKPNRRNQKAPDDDPALLKRRSAYYKRRYSQLKDELYWAKMELLKRNRSKDIPVEKILENALDVARKAQTALQTEIEKISVVLQTLRDGEPE